MDDLNTAALLLNRALQANCDQSCVDWALGMLDAGKDSPALRVLAGATHPYNHFELAQWRDEALRELGINPPPLKDAVRLYAYVRLGKALRAGDEDLVRALHELFDLCIKTDYDKSIFDFYLLDCAYGDLEATGITLHWPDASRENIMMTIKRTAKDFVARFEQDSGLR